MRVVHLSTSVSRQAGGIFDAVRGLSGALLDRGHAVTVLGVADARSDADHSEWGTVPVETVPPLGPQRVGYAPTLSAALDRLAPDLLHVHGLWMYSSVASLRWARRTGRPVVLSPHGMLDPWAVRNARWKKRLASVLFERAHLRRVAAIHALNEAELDGVRQFGLGNPVEIVPNGVELPTGEAGMPPWRGRLPAGARVLLFLGRIHPKKGLAELVEGFARVAGEVSVRPWHLAIIGWDDGGHEPALRAAAQGAGLGERVHFLGPCFGPGKDAAFAHANAFVLPSYSEGLPMAVLEAWSHRLPVVMTSACHLPSGFEHGAALEVEPDASSIAGGLRALVGLGDEGLRDMGARGRALVENRYTWARVAEAMEDVYRQVLDRKSVPA